MSALAQVTDEAAVRNTLAEIMDPELPLSIVDLGLLRGVTVEAGRVEVTMTFTSMGCPCRDWIVDDVRERIQQFPDVEQVEVKIVWNESWTRRSISPAGKKMLSEWGVSA